MRAEDSAICYVDFELIMKTGLKQPVPEVISIRMTDIIRYFHGSFGLFGIFLSNFRHVAKAFFGTKNFAPNAKEAALEKASPTLETILFAENIR